jgi:hypothetical protein
MTKFKISYSILIVLAALSPVAAADPAPARPQANGPFGNFSPLPSTVKLIDDASPALQYYPASDRLLAIRDASHSETELAFLRTKGTSIRQLADFWHPHHQNTTAYEVYMEHPFAEGLLYLRTKDSHIACYDLKVHP